MGLNKIPSVRNKISHLNVIVHATTALDPHMSAKDGILNTLKIHPASSQFIEFAFSKSPNIKNAHDSHYYCDLDPAKRVEVYSSRDFFNKRFLRKYGDLFNKTGTFVLSGGEPFNCVCDSFLDILILKAFNKNPERIMKLRVLRQSSIGLFGPPRPWTKGIKDSFAEKETKSIRSLLKDFAPKPCSEVTFHFNIEALYVANINIDDDMYFGSSDLTTFYQRLLKNSGLNIYQYIHDDLNGSRSWERTSYGKDKRFRVNLCYWRSTEIMEKYFPTFRN